MVGSPYWAHAVMKASLAALSWYLPAVVHVVALYCSFSLNCEMKKCVALFVSAAPVRVGCFLPSPAVWGLFRVLPFFCCWSALVGWLSVLECAFWGFLLLFALLYLFPGLDHP